MLNDQLTKTLNSAPTKFIILLEFFLPKDVILMLPKMWTYSNTETTYICTSTIFH